MLRVTTEIVPYGNEAQKKIISVIHIANTGEGTPEFGNYDIVEMESDKFIPKRWHATKVKRGGTIPEFLARVFKLRKVEE